MDSSAFLVAKDTGTKMKAFKFIAKHGFTASKAKQYCFCLLADKTWFLQVYVFGFGNYGFIEFTEVQSVLTALTVCYI